MGNEGWYTILIILSIVLALEWITLPLTIWRMKSKMFEMADSLKNISEHLVDINTGVEKLNQEENQK